jgi:hypothetical protein
MMKTIGIVLAIMVSLVISSPLGAAPELKVITADPGEPPESNELTMCSLGCAMGWQTKASSHLQPQGNNRYDVKNIGDYRVNTAWIEGVKGYGIGETITYTFTKEDFDKAHIEKQINFNGFMVLNGYCKNKKTWKENSRVKKILIEHNNQPLYAAILHDSMKVQLIQFDSVYLQRGDKVKVTILEVYPGDKYQDTAISELVPLGAH